MTQESSLEHLVWCGYVAEVPVDPLRGLLGAHLECHYAGVQHDN